MSISTHGNLQQVEYLTGNGVVAHSVQCYDSGGYITRMCVDPIDMKTLYYCGYITSTSAGGWKGAVDGVKVRCLLYCGFVGSHLALCVML